MYHRLQNISTAVSAVYLSIKLIRAFLHHYFTLIIVCETNIVDINACKLGLMVLGQ